MNNDIGAYIRTFIDSDAFQDADRQKWFLLAYGPYLCMDEMCDSFSDSLTQASDGQILLFRAAATLMRRLANTSCLEAKHSIRSYVMEASSDIGRLTTQFQYSKADCDRARQNTEKQATALIRQIREHQYDKALLESAMINMAPIVPYEGETLVLPMMTREDDAVQSNPPEDDSYASLLEFAFRRAWDIVLYSRRYTRVYSVTDQMVQEGQIPADMDRPYFSTQEGEDPEIRSYYMVTTLHALGYSSEQIQHYLNTLYQMTQENAGPIFQAIYDQTAYDDKTYSVTEAWEALDEEKERAVEEILHKSNRHDAFHSDKRIFDLDAMMAYIYNHREIYCNSYANTFFMTEAPRDLEINNLNYMAGNILLAEINSAYLVCPFMDLSRDRDIRLLCMDKEQRIFIQDTFEFATEPVVPENE